MVYSKTIKLYKGGPPMGINLIFPHPIVVMDTETGGLNPAIEIEWTLDKTSHRVDNIVTGKIKKLPAPILELGAIKLDPKDLKEIDCFHAICGPEKDESFEDFLSTCTPKALEVNGFKDRLNELKEAKPLSECLRNFLTWLAKDSVTRKIDKFIPCGQNVTYDIDMLNMAFARFGINYQIYEHPLELISYSRVYFSMPDTETVANYKLTTVCKALGISTDKAHTALADVKMTATALKKMLERFAGD